MKVEEFKCAIFVVDLTAQGAYLQASPNDVQRVVDCLRDVHKVTNVTLFSGGNSTKDKPRLPSDGFKVETRSYEPLTHLLNIIIHAANTCLTRPRYLEGLHFYPYDAEMREKIDSTKPLKPDILGFHSRAPYEQPVSWNDVAVFIEVKADLVETIKQLANYARTHLALNRRRSSSITMSFDHTTMILHFLCFHCSGISASPVLHLDREDGFKSFVEHMVGLLSIKDEEAFGLDMTRAEDVYRLNGSDYKIMRTIYVRGHSTVVYSLKRQNTGAQDIPATLRSRELTHVVAATQLPKEMVYKLSYQRVGRPSEGASLFLGFSGQFGVVDVIGYHTCSSEESFGSTEHLLLGAKLLPLDQLSPVVPPEYKYLHCTAMALEGLPLLDFSDTEGGIPTPPELIKTIIHSMIGHLNLFLGGVLHRDVSSGNVLRLRESTSLSIGPAKDLLSFFPFIQDKRQLRCRGFLIDGDHAIKWRKESINLSWERSGTLPFMSKRLLRALELGTCALHTAADDLESFLWVLVWSLAHILKRAVGETITDQISSINNLAEHLSSRFIPSILSRELTVMDEWKEKVFGGLLHDWLKISQKSRTVVAGLQVTLLRSLDDVKLREECLDLIDEHCIKVYQEFFRTGYEHFETIKEHRDWEAVVNFNGDLLKN